MYVSIALKKPGGTSYRSITVYEDQPQFHLLQCFDCFTLPKTWQYGDDINHWLRYMFSRFSYTNILSYNDENAIKTSKGHTKGVLLWNREKIGWLIHSVPRLLFSTRQINAIDPSQLIYGQSFLYIETEFTEQRFAQVNRQLTIMEACIYHVHGEQATEMVKSDVKVKVVENDVSLFEFNDRIVHVSKSSRWKKDLYEDFMTGYINSSVMCQTWAKPAASSTSSVKNVKTIQWKDETYQTTQDHSKYAISMSKHKPWVFFGDINHMDSQRNRGGGGLLICDLSLWKAMNQIMIEYTDVVSNPNL
jgi:deoxyribonuclease-2